MKRPLDKKIKSLQPLKEVTLRNWKITTSEEKEEYIQLDNRCFPNNPMTLDKLNWHLEKQWIKGTAIGAFDKEGTLIGNLMAYWFDSKEAITDEIFVSE
jgi:hypothetical protein